MPEHYRQDSRENKLRAGFVGAGLLFVCWLAFSSFGITFYRQDNVVLMGPLLIDAARQVRTGTLPLHTYWVGGGGGTPLASIMQPGVFYPLKLIPAMLFGSHPELMTNLIVSFHLALFGLGGWYMAWTLGAGMWARAIALLSLGFCGCYIIGAGNYEALFLPYTFLPWAVGGIVRLARSDAPQQVRVAHGITAVAGIATFYSGGPSAAFYDLLVVLFIAAFLVLEDPRRLLVLLKRLAFQLVLLAVVVGPLLWEAEKVYDYYGRRHVVEQWRLLSVPAAAYVGLFVPGTAAVWEHIGRSAATSNFVLFCGLVPPWFAVLALFFRPSLLRDTGFLVLLAGIGVFILVLSPPVFHATELFARTRLLDLFKYPFRGLPAFHVLVVFVFLVLATRVAFDGRPGLQWLFVILCVVSCVYSVSTEYFLARPGERVLSWFVAERFYADPETWSSSTLERIRGSGYVIHVARPQVRGLWFEKPRLFFAGNLGAQLRVPTVHRDVFSAQSPGYRELGMLPVGMITNWPAVKAFIETGPTRPPGARPTWENGIGPRDLAELRSKTYVGAIIVETALKEPVHYLVNTPEWQLVETRSGAAVFARKAE